MRHKEDALCLRGDEDIVRSGAATNYVKERRKRNDMFIVL